MQICPPGWKPKVTVNESFQLINSMHTYKKNSFCKYVRQGGNRKLRLISHFKVTIAMGVSHRLLGLLELH